MNIFKTTYLSLGTNQGDKIKNLQSTIDLISNEIGCILKISSIYETPSWGFSGNNFYNITIKVNTRYSPNTLMTKLLAIEERQGRKRTNADGYANRIIDIDILLYDNQTINSEKVVIPHPRMLLRKFVLVPLVEIAEKEIHPTKKIQLTACLEGCEDDTKISTIKANLSLPKSIRDRYDYIAIEGNIGAGKTSLTELITNQFGGQSLLERFADNPFLPKFYKNQERYAFPLEMSFLADRFQQFTNEITKTSTDKFLISDYYIFKSLIFSKITLQNDEYAVYKQIFDILYKEVKKPDLYIYLYQDPKHSLNNIKKRGRSYEQDIDLIYLEKIQENYLKHLKTIDTDIAVLTINTNDLDFVNNIEDYNHVLKLIKDYKK